VRRIDPLAAVSVVLFVVLLVLSGLTAATPTSRSVLPSASVYDESAGGASILKRYLELAGVRVETVEGDRFAPNDLGATLFLLAPSDELSSNDRQQLHTFVRSGGTLVVGLGTIAINEPGLLREFGIAPTGAAARGDVPVRSIAFSEPPVRTVSLDAGYLLRTTGTASPIVFDGPEAIVMVGSDGLGTVYAVGSVTPFINQSIGHADNAHFALALALAAGNRRAAFDEYHHGVRPAPDFLALLSGTWIGRALLAAFGLIFLYLLLTGRRLGPPLPLDPRPPRSSLEFIRGFAGLARRSGRGEIARRRLRAELRRGLARTAGLDPDTPFDRVANAVAQQSASRGADARALDEALAGRLRGDALVRAANDVQRLVSPEEAS
jgi:uncharacterized protein DUF4350